MDLKLALSRTGRRLDLPTIIVPRMTVLATAGRTLCAVSLTTEVW
jgi:hypothetical protein